MTTTPVIANDTLAGCGLYLELKRDTPEIIYTAQMLILPEGKTSDGIDVPMTTFYRRISRVHPRRNWSCTSASTYATRLWTNPSLAYLVSPARTDKIVEDISAILRRQFETFTKYDYTLVGEPIVIEVTAEDLSSARLGRMPYKVLGRVNKGRKALKYPEKIIVS